MSGTLYGIGLGPGAPDLVTLRAARVIGAAPVVAYIHAPGRPSLARSIAAELIAPGASEIAIEVPMLPGDEAARAPVAAAYDEGAARIAAALQAGRDVACLCEGDALFYGSFMYLLDRLAAVHPVQVVPGIPAISAASAAARLPLLSRNERLLVLPAPGDDAALTEALGGAAEAVAILKVGRHLPRLRAVIAAAGLERAALYVERATMEGERVLPLAEAPDEAPYFSMILIRKEPA